MFHQAYPAKFRYQGKYAHRYLSKRAGSQKWQREQEVVERVVKGFPRGSSVLDVPLGTGRFSEIYEGGNHVVYGLDISTDMLCRARQQRTPGANILLLQAEAEFIPLGNGTVDYVVCTRLMNWLPLSIFAQIIAEFKRLVRKGIIVEVRVGEPLRPTEVIRNLWSDLMLKPGATVLRPMRWLRGKVSFVLSSRRGAFVNEGLMSTRHSDVGSVDGYFVHSVEDVIRVFSEQGLVAEEIALVDKRTVYFRREFQPLLMYVLRPSDSPKNDV